MSKQQQLFTYKLPVKSFDEKMYDIIFKNTTSSYKLLIAISFSIFVILSKNIFELLVATAIVFILMRILKKSVKYCVEIIKRIFLWLIFISVLYIILYNDHVGLLVLNIKIVYIIICVSLIVSELDFDQLNKGINFIFKPLSKLTYKLYDFTYNLSIVLYTFSNYIDYMSKEHNNSYKEITSYCQKEKTACVSYINYIQQLLGIIKTKNYSINNVDKMNQISKMRIIIIDLCLVLMLYIFRK